MDSLAPSRSAGSTPARCGWSGQTHAAAAALSPAAAALAQQPVSVAARGLVQNASLEIAWTRVVVETGPSPATCVMPFLTEGYEGFDVNTPYDWDLAESLVSGGQAQLPRVTP